VNAAGDHDRNVTMAPYGRARGAVPAMLDRHVRNDDVWARGMHAGRDADRVGASLLEIPDRFEGIGEGHAARHAIVAIEAADHRIVVAQPVLDRLDQLDEEACTSA